MSTCFAHTAPQKSDWEPLKDHLLKVATRAEQFAAVFDAGQEAYAAGLLHDLGKYGELFQKRLCGTESHIDHWTAGAWAAISKYGSKAGRCMALAIQGHHIGLQIDNKQAFIDGICKCKATVGTKLSDVSMSPLLGRLSGDQLELPPLATSFYIRNMKYCSDMLDVRMLYSSLVDADYLETEKFMNTVEGCVLRSTAPSLDAPRALDVLLKHIQHMRANNKSLREDVDAMRTTLLDSCLSAGKGQQAVYTLSAPTGSGKTLSMLAFALRHAVENPQLKRLIVVLPFLNVIEQTASVYREVFKEFPAGYIIEHHSLAGLQKKDSDSDVEDEKSAAYGERLAAENWDAPIIITTNVQFLESLFSNRPSACRKLHNIAGSVVLFDEVQTLPTELTIHTLSALSRLTERYLTTVVFATATQPAFSHLNQGTLEWCNQGWSPRAMLTQETEAQLFHNARRVRYHWSKGNERLLWEAIAGQMIGRQKKQALCVVNTKKQALELTKCLRDNVSADEHDSVFHFSTNMCPQHRRDKLIEIKARLDSHQPCYLVATQCIEAGVDISFPVVFRAWAPLESIIQTAGRCNRNNELYPEMGDCYVFTPLEEKYPSVSYDRVTATARAFVDSLDDASKAYMHNPTVVEKYYTTVYDFLGHITSSPKFKELSESLKGSHFPDVAAKYRLISQDTINLVVHYGEGEKLIKEVHAHGFTGEWARRAQLCSVAVRRPRHDDDLLGIMEPIPIFRGRERFESEDWFACTSNAKYDTLTGLEVPRGNDFLDA